MAGSRKPVTSLSWILPLQKSIVLFSLLEIVCLGVFCSGKVIPNQRTGASIGTGSITTNTNSDTGKTQTQRVMHPAFANAGRDAGLQIWRIENFEPVAYPQRDYGKFYTGDSYIILNTKKDRSNQLSWDVHFWLGSETSTDEAGAAAILTIQLDDSLNGDPVQHREVQDHESSLFLNYFRNGVRYEKGGVGTGFRHVDPNSPGEKRLFQVKGKRNVRVRQVNLSVSSMNKGDCFILDAGNDIYVYVGSSAKRVEKLKAISAANQIRDQDHNGRARVQIIDEFSTDTDRQNFFNVLGSGSPDQVPEESTAEEDAAFEANEERIVTLYKVTDQAGALKVETISTKPIRQEMLDTNDCFILDTGSGSGLYVWIGRGATQQEKSQSMVKAQEFLTTNKYPVWTQVHRIVEGAESATFKQYFATWRDAGMAHTRLVRAINISPEDIDENILLILKKSGGRALSFMPDNGNGEITGVWYFKNGAMEEVPSDSYNTLFGDRAYVVRYSYDDESGNKALVNYNWVGKDATAEDKKLSFENAETDTSGDSSVPTIIVRITQGHEIRHFRKIFRGKLFTRSKENDLALYRVRGTQGDDTVTEELPFASSSFASDDAFIVVSSGKCYVWNGKGASNLEKSQAENLARTLHENVEIINEGSEPEEFWDIVGGKSAYDTTINPPGPPILDPRLFHCKIRYSGRFVFEEIQDFKQEDMDIDDIMLVDAGDEIYIWIGEGSTPEEENSALKMATEYIRKDPTERTEDTVPLIKIRQRQEPGCFRRLFSKWDDGIWELFSSYDDVKKEIADANDSLGDL